MANISKDRKQAKVFDKYIYGEPLIWRRNCTHHEQTYRNNHYAPKNLFANKRISAMPGTWGIVVATDIHVAWEMCFALDENSLVPEEIGKILCINPACLGFYPEEAVAAIEAAEIPIVYDIGETSPWNCKPLVSNELLEIDRNQKYGYGVHAIWHGEVPGSYIDYAEAKARHDAYEKAAKELSERFHKLGRSWYHSDSQSRAINALSFGLVGIDEFPLEPENPRENRRDNVTVYEYEPTDYSVEYTEAFKKIYAVVDVWEKALESSGITLHHSWTYDQNKPDYLARAVATGQALGYDSYMSAHLLDGVPLSDLFA